MWPASLRWDAEPHHQEGVYQMIGDRIDYALAVSIGSQAGNDSMYARWDREGKKRNRSPAWTIEDMLAADRAQQAEIARQRGSNRP
jgi:hypothetical protein